jgi:uncharacterized protein YkwD
LGSKRLVVYGGASVIVLLATAIIVWVAVIQAANQGPSATPEVNDSSPKNIAPQEKKSKTSTGGQAKSRQALQEDIAAQEKAAQENFHLPAEGDVQGVEFEENNSREGERGGKAPAQTPQENDASSTVVAKTCSGTSIELYAGEKQMLDLHNRTRSERGLPLLCINPILTKTARDHSQDMLDKGYFSHYSPEGSTPFDRMKRVGYTSCGRTSICGENLAVGASYPSTPERLFEALMNSPGHRANILRKEFREVGIGLQVGNYKKYDGTASMYSIEFAGQP